MTKLSKRRRLAARNAVLALGIYLLNRRLNSSTRGKRTRTKYISDFYQRRYRKGEYTNLIEELNETNDDAKYVEYFRMTKADFDIILNLLGKMSNRNHAYPIENRVRLALTLRILASGESFKSISMRYRISPSAVHNIFHYTCKKIWFKMQPLYAKAPATPDEWATISDRFWSQWNFPGCIGAIDGKHVAIKAPPNSGSLYRNFKGFFSVSFMAVVDADYNFLLVDVGAYGQQSDGGIFANSRIGQKFEDGMFAFNKSSLLPGTDVKCNNVLVGDEAYPLKDYLMRPFPGRNLTNEHATFNYRLSRARRVVENAFGLLASRWRIFLHTIEMLPKNVDYVIKAAICLHNYCNKVNNTRYHTDLDHIPGSLSFNPDMLQKGPNKNSSKSRDIRELLTQYFQSEPGKLNWQDNVNQV